MYHIAQKKGSDNLNQEKLLKATVESSKKRISYLNKLFSRIYEDNVIRKLSDERYSHMAGEYESEQKKLLSKVVECEKKLAKFQKKSVDIDVVSRTDGIYRGERTEPNSGKQAHWTH